MPQPAHDIGIVHRTKKLTAALQHERRWDVPPRNPPLFRRSPMAAAKTAETTVEQKLPDGKMVTITSVVQLAEGESKGVAREEQTQQRAMAQRAAKAMPEVTVQRRGLLIRLSGSLPVDSLNVLAAKIR